MSEEDNALDDFIRECQNPRNIVRGDFVKRDFRSVPVVPVEMIEFKPYLERVDKCKQTKTRQK